MGLVGETIAWLTDPANWQGSAGIPARTLEHVLIAGASLLLAAMVALPSGMLVGHTRRGMTQVINLANLGRALPSLAIIGLAIPITAAIDPQLGFKVYPTVIAMIVLAIPTILVNTATGISGVDPELVEAGRGMGMAETSVLRRVELPIAMAVIIGGLRSAAVQVVATATLGAIFGGPGLGRFLVEGYAQQATIPGMLWGGVVLVALLALATEGAFALLQRVVTSPGLRPPRRGWGARLTPARVAAD
jgi:osmoprotectant transport system permease protein